MIQDYERCPKCGSKNSVKIIYGKPNSQLFKKAELEEIKLGGCVLSKDSPDYFCKDCGNEWSRRQIRETCEKSEIKK